MNIQLFTGEKAGESSCQSVWSFVTAFSTPSLSLLSLLLNSTAPFWIARVPWIGNVAVTHERIRHRVAVVSDSTNERHNVKQLICRHIPTSLLHPMSCMRLPMPCVQPPNDLFRHLAFWSARPPYLYCDKSSRQRREVSANRFGNDRIPEIKCFCIFETAPIRLARIAHFYIQSGQSKRHRYLRYYRQCIASTYYVSCYA